MLQVTRKSESRQEKELHTVPNSNNRFGYYRLSDNLFPINRLFRSYSYEEGKWIEKRARFILSRGLWEDLKTCTRRAQVFDISPSWTSSGVRSVGLMQVLGSQQTYLLPIRKGLLIAVLVMFPSYDSLYRRLKFDFRQSIVIKINKM